MKHTMKHTFKTLYPFGLWVALGATLAVPTLAQDSKALADGLFSSKKPPVILGETSRYNIEIKIVRPSTPSKVIKISEQFDRITQDTQPDDTITLVDTFTSGTVSFGTAPQDITKMLPVVTIMRNKQGKFTTKADGGSAEGNPEVIGVLQQFAATADNLLPAKPVKTGEKWKIAFTNANTLLGGSMLAGEAELGGRSCLMRRTPPG